MLTLWFVTDWINEGFHSFLLLIDAVVYWFVSVCYNLFVFLATEPIFKEEFFTDFARRIYAILGVFMLFYLAYALLNALVDPDKLSKGDKSVSKLAMNLVISLILLGLSPTIFNYAYRLQNYILSSNLIGAIVMGSELEETNSITSFGDELSFTVMNTFINPENADAYMGDNEYWSNYEESVKGEKHDYMGLPGLSKCVTKGCVIKSDDGSEGSNKNVITYYPFVSTGAGIFLIYIILSFTLDLGVRVFKFAFCQLLAPIPIVMRAMPGKKAQFDKWLKLTITVYLEVFVRVGCMYLAVYFIQALRKNITFTELFEGSKIMGMIALVILIMGVFSFAKQAPKMLSEMLGFDSGNLKLGFGEKLKAGGFFGGVSAVGALVASRGNPFAVARAWNAGNKDGNFHQIGKEAELRRKVQLARQNGSTWMGRRVNDVRNFFGYDTTADAMDRAIEHNKYNGLTYRGDPVTKELLESNKDRLNGLNAAIDEQIRNRKTRYDPIEANRAATQAILDSLKTSVERETSKSTGSVNDLGYGSVTGNYAAMKKRIDEMNEAFRPDRDKFSDDASFQAAFQEHQNKMAQYYQALSDEKDAMQDALYQGILNNTPNHIADADVNNAIELSRQHHATMEADLTSLKSLRNTEKEQALEINREISNLESQKIDNTNELGEISRIEAQAEENAKAAKHRAGYQARNADKDSRSSK